MTLMHLQISGIRNLTDTDLYPTPEINIISGLNGSGKTSMLEAIYILGSGKSFRSTKVNPIIQAGLDHYTVHGKLSSDNNPIPVGITKQRAGKQIIKIANESVNNLGLLAVVLPLQIVNSDSFLLLEGGPKQRRQFIDWGVFHVEPLFVDAWRNGQRCLKHRNVLLKRNDFDVRELKIWDKEFVEVANKINKFRCDYIERFKPVFHNTLNKLIKLPELRLEFYRGWSDDKELDQVLNEQKDKDKLLGYTLFGPQKADLRLLLDKYPATEILSRGQQKLVVTALKLAQGFLLSQISGKSCVYLVDDLPAELDENHRRSVCQLLSDLNYQVFVTCVDYASIIDYWPEDKECKMFHVKHGNVTELDKIEWNRRVKYE